MTPSVQKYKKTFLLGGGHDSGGGMTPGYTVYFKSIYEFQTNIFEQISYYFF
jgi:hypothetical protein